ncbi:MAG: hypothetical protein AAB532_01135 [Patescibacteria group bacterium]
MESTVTEGQSFRPETLLGKGSDVALVKRGLLTQQDSAVSIGQALVGKLVKDVRIGEVVDLGIANTSPVRRIIINELTGRINLDTQTSRYELLDKRFKGLDLEIDGGSIHLPVDSQPARLDDRVVDLSFPGGRIHINKPALRDVLLETHGTQIFRAVDFRLMVLARVGNIHLPFYVSSEGTSGKNEGEWYPFFGYTGDWIIKGSGVTNEGKMDYHPKVDAVREILNKNLILPIFMSPQGKLGYEPMTRQEPSLVIFDINNHLDYKAVDIYAREDEKRFVSDMTGYLPTNVRNTHLSATPWIDNVVSSIK